MFKLITSVVGCIFVATLFGEGEGLKCYHCYDSFSDILSLHSIENVTYGDRFVRCDKNQNNWNTWLCPAEYSVCVIMSARVKDHTEIIRSCEKRDICKTYRPPSGVELKTCRECDTTLCNDYLGLPVPTTSTPVPTTSTPVPTISTPVPTTSTPIPTSPPIPTPPVNPNFLLNFNININLSTKKNPRVDNEYLK